MTKQPTRLADFDIPREHAPTPAFLQPEVRAALQDTQPDAPPAELASLPLPLMQAAPPAPAPFLQPKAPAQEEPRRQLAARVRLSVAERLRTFLFVERESQQDAVEAALDSYLRERGY